MVHASAPGKLMLFGEHSVVYNRPCIVTAVSHRMSVSIEKRDDNKLVFSAPNFGIHNYTVPVDNLKHIDEKRLKFVFQAVKNFFNKFSVSSGLTLETESEFSASFGLGSSSAVTVSTIKALAELFDKKITKREIFDLAFKTVLDVQGVGSGFDVAISVYGGTIYYVTAGKVIEELGIKDFPLTVAYSGIKADTTTIVKNVKKMLDDDPNLVNGVFDKITDIVEKSKIAFKNDNYEEVGKLMNHCQEELRKLEISTTELENLISTAIKAGVYGAKLSGAGGGDCMIALGNKDNLTKALESAGGKVISVHVNEEGVRVEKS